MGLAFNRSIIRHIRLFALAGALSGLALFSSLFFAPACPAEVISKLPTAENAVAVTLDACATKIPSHLDMKILDFLTGEKIPFTIFVSGKFAEWNREALREVSRHDFVRIENHSNSHPMHMERLNGEKVRAEVLEAEESIARITGRKPVFFRFPAGNYDRPTLAAVEALGYRVVHWTFPSGDPDPHTTAVRMSRWVLSQTRPGSILIFHVNGRGYHTGEALPTIVKGLRERGYAFRALEDFL